MFGEDDYGGTRADGGGRGRGTVDHDESARPESKPHQQPRRPDTRPMPPMHSIHHGVVKATIAAGAIIELTNFKSGLCHLSQLSGIRVDSATDVVSKGDSVWVKVVSLDTEKDRVGLSLRSVDQTSGADLDCLNLESEKLQRGREGAGGRDRDDGAGRDRDRHPGDRAPITLGAVVTSTCSRCGGFGHMAHECFAALGGPRYELVSAADDFKAAHAASAAAAAPRGSDVAAQSAAVPPSRATNTDGGTATAVVAPPRGRQAVLPHWMTAAAAATTVVAPPREAVLPHWMTEAVSSEQSSVVEHGAAAASQSSHRVSRWDNNAIRGVVVTSSAVPTPAGFSRPEPEPSRSEPDDGDRTNSSALGDGRTRRHSRLPERKHDGGRRHSHHRRHHGHSHHRHRSRSEASSTSGSKSRSPRSGRGGGRGGDADAGASDRHRSRSRHSRSPKRIDSDDRHTKDEGGDHRRRSAIEAEQSHRHHHRRHHHSKHRRSVSGSPS